MSALPPIATVKATCRAVSTRISELHEILCDRNWPRIVLLRLIHKTLIVVIGIERWGEVAHDNGLHACLCSHLANVLRRNVFIVHVSQEGFLLGFGFCLPRAIPLVDFNDVVW